MSSNNIDIDILRGHLTPPISLRLYAIVDAAGNSEALDYLYEQDTLSFDCLFPGDIEPEIFEVAPFLIDLEAQEETLEWLLKSWGQSWFVFLHSPNSLEQLQIHLRQFTQVRTPDEEVVWFRFYDPRVMRTAIPLLTSNQAEAFFEGVETFLCESSAPNSLARITFEGSETLVSLVPIA
jgi:Domain of unknown function (DUF4123)